MSNEDSFAVVKKLEVLHKIASVIGCKLESPFMIVAFMTLFVISSIKISDHVLFGGDNFEFVDVIIDFVSGTFMIMNCGLF